MAVINFWRSLYLPTFSESNTYYKLLMCWEKLYFKRFDFLPAIPPGNSRDELLSQKQPTKSHLPVVKAKSSQCSRRDDPRHLSQTICINCHPILVAHNYFILLSLCLHYYLFIAWRGIMHATIYLFQILSSVSTFFPQIFNSLASICTPLAQKDTFYQATVEHHHN